MLAETHHDPVARLSSSMRRQVGPLSTSLCTSMIRRPGEADSLLGVNPHHLRHPVIEGAWRGAPFVITCHLQVVRLPALFVRLRDFVQS